MIAIKRRCHAASRHTEWLDEHCPHDHEEDNEQREDLQQHAEGMPETGMVCVC